MNKRLFVFLEFLIGGVLLGIIEDFIIIKIVSNEVFSLEIFFIVLLVTIPFAFFGEFIIDKIDFIKLFHLTKRYKRLEIFFEFLIFGVLFGVVEDLTAFYFAVGDKINFKIIITLFLITIPFAFISEFLIDRVDFSKSLNLKKIYWKKE